MGSGIALTDAAIMSTTLEGILYGFSLLMFIGTIWVLSQEKGRHESNRTMIAVAVILLILSTAHMVIDIVRVDEGLVKYAGGSLAYFEDVAQYTFVAKNAIYSIQTLLGDGVVIHRCYVVWQSIWVIILPSLLWCGVAVTAAGSVYSVSQATINATNIFAKETGQWITSFYAMTLTTNLISSGLLAYRIWTIERSVSRMQAARKNTLMPVVRVLVDAAILYSATLFTALVCFANSNNGQYVLLDMIMPIISIAFYMVLIRIALRRKRIHYSSQRGTATAVESQGTGFGMKPLQVHISQFSKTDSVRPHRSGTEEVESENWYATRAGGSTAKFDA